MWYIWTIRNSKTTRYTFRQRHVSGLIQRLLDFFYISNSIQGSVKNSDVVASLFTDHLAITVSYFKNEESNRSRGFRKINNSFIENEQYVHQTKKLILPSLNYCFSEKILGNQVKWKYLKNSIRKYTINFSKKLTKTAYKKNRWLRNKT